MGSTCQKAVGLRDVSVKLRVSFRNPENFLLIDMVFYGKYEDQSLDHSFFEWFVGRHPPINTREHPPPQSHRWAPNSKRSVLPVGSKSAFQINLQQLGEKNAPRLKVSIITPRLNPHGTDFGAKRWKPARISRQLTLVTTMKVCWTDGRHAYIVAFETTQNLLLAINKWWKPWWVVESMTSRCSWRYGWMYRRNHAYISLCTISNLPESTCTIFVSSS